MAKLVSGIRIKFNSKNSQIDFFNKIAVNLIAKGIKWSEIADELHVSQRTLLDWRKAKHLPTQSAVKLLSSKYNIVISKHTTVLDSDRRLGAAAIGGRATLKKFGRVPIDEPGRLNAWRVWWKKKGSKNPELTIGKYKPVILPPPGSALAEWVGIVLGDGGVSPYQIIITTHEIDDKKYRGYISDLTCRLFRVNPSTRKEKRSRAVGLVISRKSLVEYCIKNLGLVIGNKIKNNVSIPSWITQDKNYLKACLRGLFDTDGCVVIHRYRVGNKNYQYHKLMFSNASNNLIRDFQQSLFIFNIKSRINRQGNAVFIDSAENVKKYFGCIGFSNPKHLKRYKI